MSVRGGACTLAECMDALKGLALPRASHSGEIALAGSRCLRFTLAAAPVLFKHDIITEANNSTSATMFVSRLAVQAQGNHSHTA